jgi:hypothetical protein
MYFLAKGSCGYVLPRYANKIFFEFKPGDHFGHTDLGNEADFIDPNMIGKVTIFSKEELVRRFTT